MYINVREYLELKSQVTELEEENEQVKKQYIMEKQISEACEG